MKYQESISNIQKNNFITLNSELDKDIADTEDRLKKIYYIAVKTRNFEIGQLVQRNNFFMIFQGVLLASMITSKETVPFVQSVVSATGFYIAYLQTQVAAGAKFWQEYWEDEVYEAENNLKEFYNKKFSADLLGTKSRTTLEFIPIFTKDDTEVFNQVKKRLNPKLSSPLPVQPIKIIKLPRLINFFLLGGKFSPNIFSTKNLILTKPSVSKIPIRVGQCLIISWAILFLSSLGIFNKILESKFITTSVIRGLPTHQESIKQEIYFSQDKEKTGPLYLANNEKRNDKNEIIGPSIPFEIKSDELKNLANSNEVFINIHIDEKGNKTTTYKFIENEDFDTK